MRPYYSDEWVTLYLGDCREATDWLAADVLVTDPPYGMRLRSGRGGAFGTSVVDGDHDAAIRDEALAMWRRPRRRGETWGRNRPALVFGRWSVPRPEGTRMVLTWEKGEHVGMGDLSLPWKPNTEEIYVLGSGFTGHRGSSVLRYLAVAGTVGQAGRGTRHHPTEKPVDLMRDLILKCPPGVIADPFAGSGTTLRAAKDLGRRAIGIEKDERYCEAAARRLGQGVLELTG